MASKSTLHPPHRPTRTWKDELAAVAMPEMACGCGVAPPYEYVPTSDLLRMPPTALYETVTGVGKDGLCVTAARVSLRAKGKGRRGTAPLANEREYANARRRRGWGRTG